MESPFKSSHWGSIYKFQTLRDDKTNIFTYKSGTLCPTQENVSPKIFRCSRKDPYFTKTPPTEGIANSSGGISKGSMKLCTRILPEGVGGGSLKIIFCGGLGEYGYFLELHVTIYSNPRLSGIK